MSYLKFKADHLFDGYRLWDDKHVLITDENGIIENIAPIDDAGDGIQSYHGILSPGLINCHCHLELSHLRNVIPPHTGLIEFLCSVVTKREASPNPSDGEAYEDPAITKMNSIVAAEKEMYDNGIVAVGDIGNTADTADVKSKSNIRWQNFVEVLSFTDEKADENIEHYKKVAQVFENQNLQIGGRAGKNQSRNRTSLVPHASYSISPKTFRKINEITKGQVISIHNQENPAEDELYKTGGGGYLKLFKIFGMNTSPFPVTGKSSIRSYLPYFNNKQTIFLVHNTYMPEEDVIWASEYARAYGLRLVYCVCVNANLYIENKVPPIEMLLKNNCTIVLGTDSYSSNWQLSIAKEMEAIQKNFPKLFPETILQWATLNGASALHWDNEFGSFEKGKKPGVILLSSDFSDSKRLV